MGGSDLGGSIRLKDFICDIHVMSSTGQAVLKKQGVTMRWVEAESRWENADCITVKPSHPVQIDHLEIWKDGHMVRSSQINTCFLTPVDTLSIAVGAYQLDIDASTRNILALATGPDPEPVSDEEMAKIAQQLVAMEMSLAKKPRRKPLKAPERPLRAKPL